MGDREYQECPECGWYWSVASYESSGERCPVCVERAEVLP